MAVNKKPTDIIEDIKELERRLSILERTGGLNNLLSVVYTDATRPTAGVEGRVIYNSDDGQLNIDNGTDWTLPDGTVT